MVALTRKIVETDIADDSYIGIKKGVEVGARIVSGPARALRFLHDGDRVREIAVAEEKGTAATARAAREEAVIELAGISKIYELGGTAYPALDNVSLSIGGNEFVALTGASGSGKSTMMNILGCLDTPTSGRYTLDGEEVAGPRRRAARLGTQPQDRFRVPEFLPDAARHRARQRGAAADLSRIAPTQRRAHAERALKRVGLGDRMQHRPNELSGGQRQRVAVARALVGRPELLLADEPTGNLDSRTAREIMDLFAQLHAEGQAVVIVTHDPTIAASCKRQVRLHDGHIAEDRSNG